MRSRRKRWAARVAYKEEKLNEYVLLVRTPEGVTPLGRTKSLRITL
jgi:hypothetical protein